MSLARRGDSMLGILTSSAGLSEGSLCNVVRDLIYLAVGKTHTYVTPVEENDTVQLCWDVLEAIAVSNLHRLPTLWPHYQEYSLRAVGEAVSPSPFAEKAAMSMFRILIKLYASSNAAVAHNRRVSEELVMKSLNLMVTLDKDVLDLYCEEIVFHISRILTDYASAVTTFGWRTMMVFLIRSGRREEVYDQAVELVMMLMSDGKYATPSTYEGFLQVAFHFSAHITHSPLENRLNILGLLANSVNWVIDWHKSGSCDVPGSKASLSVDKLFKILCGKLRMCCVSPCDEIRNHAVEALRGAFVQFVEETEMPPSDYIGEIFEVLDKLLKNCSWKENTEQEMLGLENTLGKVINTVVVDVFLRFLPLLGASSGFQSLLLSLFRRLDACMNADIGIEAGEGVVQRILPDILRRMVLEMKAKKVLVKGNELWNTTKKEIQLIYPQFKDELFK